MTFVHENNFEPFPKLEVHNHKGMRFYENPEGLKYPSITTVLGRRPDKVKSLKEWRVRVGNEQANKISGKAARRGTVFHNMVEDYLQNNIETIDEYKQQNFLAYCMFGEAKSHLDECIHKIILQETSMYSDKFEVAGRVDCIAEFNGGGLAVIDFKTTTMMKKREWMDDYFVQCAAYASMFEEHTGVPIPKVVIMMVSEDGEIQILEENTTDFYPSLQKAMKDFYENLDLDK